MSRRSNPKFDVFVSYHGGDTGTNFTNHLAAAIKRREIGMYKVDVVIPRGAVIWNELMKAIEASRVAVIIFSKTMLLLLGVWTRQQNENFAMKVKDDNYSRLKRWKSALTQAANLAGLDLKPNRSSGRTLLAEQNEAEAPKEHVYAGSKAQDHGFRKRYARSLSAPPYFDQVTAPNKRMKIDPTLTLESFGAYVADPKSSAKLQAKQTNSTSLEQRLEEQCREFEARFKALEVELARLRDGRTTDKTE
ncbi:hypothetical protein CMV_027471 [Castanea mollissima]|uniref:TIR domain-containing protein n=1 Tax=Castanea mollissima TaxID=60419 RepID=A0A8J4V9C8_9ROSI|nr:hypothetical protein CMV_027471 [Castanea mollissima]